MAPRRKSKTQASAKQATIINPPLFKISSTTGTTSLRSSPMGECETAIDALGRVQSDVLLAIQPIHMQNITSGKKEPRVSEIPTTGRS